MHNKPINQLVNGDIRGWQDINANSEAKMKGMLDIADLYKQTFNTESGRKVLAIMMSSTIMQPTVMPSASQFEAGIREGRADIVRGIMRQIELAETGGKETLQPWQTLTPPTLEPVQRKPRKPKQQPT